MPEKLELTALETCEPNELISALIRESTELVHVVGLLSEEITNLCQEEAPVSKTDLSQLASYIEEELRRVRRVVTAAALNQQIKEADTPGIFVAEASDHIGILVGGALKAGEQVLTTGRISDLPVTLVAAVQVGEKIVIRDLKAGDTIFNYGLPLGTASQPIPAGTTLTSEQFKPLQ